MKAALCKLENDPGLADRTNLTPTQIADLLNFVLRSTYFQYNGSIYEQKDGAAMGSPVSAVIANLYMEEFEERVIATATYKPKIWKRYVDDTSAVSEEKKHLSSVLVSNGYPSSFVGKLTKTTRPRANKEPTQEVKSTAVLPYIKGVSEVIRRCLQQQGVRTVFKSDTTLRSHLVRPKDALEPTKQDGVLYKIPCECGKVYIGETGRAMQDRIKQHDRDIRLARTQTSAVSEHANETGHLPIWKQVKLTGTHVGSKRLSI